jgi:hypothetical protein
MLIAKEGGLWIGPGSILCDLLEAGMCLEVLLHPHVLGRYFHVLRDIKLMLPHNSIFLRYNFSRQVAALFTSLTVE